MSDGWNHNHLRNAERITNRINESLSFFYRDQCSSITHQLINKIPGWTHKQVARSISTSKYSLKCKVKLAPKYINQWVIHRVLWFSSVGDFDIAVNRCVQVETTLVGGHHWWGERERPSPASENVSHLSLRCLHRVCGGGGGGATHVTKSLLGAFVVVFVVIYNKPWHFSFTYLFIIVYQLDLVYIATRYTN